MSFVHTAVGADGVVGAALLPSQRNRPASALAAGGDADVFARVAGLEAVEFASLLGGCTAY